MPSEDIWCDLPEVVVKSTSSVNIFTRVVSPRGIFYPRRISVPDDVAEQLLVTDVKVGKNSQFVGSACVPCSLFAESSVVCLRFDGVPPGMGMVISVTNKSSRDVTFRGKVLGSRERRGESLPLVLGLGSTKVEGLASIDVESQVAIQPTSIHVSRTVSAGIVVREVRTGPYLDVSGGSRISPEVLQELGERSTCGALLAPDEVLLPGTFLTLVVESRDGRPHNFQGAVLGTAVMHPFKVDLESFY